MNQTAPNRSALRGVLLLTAAAVLAVTAGIDFLSLHRDDLLIPSDNLSRHGLLSDYFHSLRHTPGDADVYIFEGEEPGGHLLILGGTHPNEPAGFIAAVVLLENTRVSRGKVVIIPQVNRSGFTHSDPFEGNPQRFAIPTGSGKRWFRYGSRLTNPVHQWPDPALHINPSGQKLAGAEARNLNRSYPGRRQGNLTERVAFAVMQVLDQERIEMAVDLHEAAPEYPVVNAIVFHDRSAELAAMTLMELQLAGLDFRLEESPLNLRGLSHREWGDHAGIHAFLFESANASHGRLKGRPSPDLILAGKDKNYVKAAELGRLFVPFDERGIPLKARVARHIAAISALLISWEQLHPESGLTVSGWPDADAVRRDGIGRFLHPPQ
jgi:hypothetical protein